MNLERANTSNVEPCYVGHVSDTQIKYDSSNFYVLSRMHDVSGCRVLTCPCNMDVNTICFTYLSCLKWLLELQSVKGWPLIPQLLFTCKHLISM